MSPHRSVPGCSGLPAHPPSPTPRPLPDTLCGFNFSKPGPLGAERRRLLGIEPAPLGGGRGWTQCQRSAGTTLATYDLHAPPPERHHTPPPSRRRGCAGRDPAEGSGAEGSAAPPRPAAPGPVQGPEAAPPPPAVCPRRPAGGRAARFYPSLLSGVVLSLLEREPGIGVDRNPFPLAVISACSCSGLRFSVRAQPFPKHLPHYLTYNPSLDTKETERS